MMTTASQTRSKSEMGHSRPKEPALPASRCPLLSKSDLIVSRTRNDANGHEETHAPQQNGCLFFLPKGTSSSLRKAVIGNADLYSYSRQKMQIALARYPRFSSRLSLDASENEHSIFKVSINRRLRDIHGPIIAVVDYRARHATED